MHSLHKSTYPHLDTLDLACLCVLSVWQCSCLRVVLVVLVAVAVVVPVAVVEGWRALAAKMVVSQSVVLSRVRVDVYGSCAQYCPALCARCSFLVVSLCSRLFLWTLGCFSELVSEHLVLWSMEVILCLLDYVVPLPLAASEVVFSLCLVRVYYCVVELLQLLML